MTGPSWGVSILAAVAFLLSPGALAAAEAEVPQAPPAFTPLPTSVFAELPFVEDIDLSPDGTHIAGLFGIGGEQRIMMMPLQGDRSKSVRIAVPDQTQVAWIRWVGNDNIVVGLYALMPVETDRWYISRVIGINRGTGKITKLLWDSGGQNASDVLWIPSDGSTEILVAAQNSIYGNDPEFWPTVYRVDVASARKRVVERPRANVNDWGADHLGQVRFGIGYRDSDTQSTLLFRSHGEGTLRVIDRAKLGAEEELTVPFHFVPGSNNGFVIKPIEDGRSAVVEVDIPTGKDVRTVYAADKADVEGVLTDSNGSKLLGVRTSDRSDPLHWIDPAMAAHQKTLEAASPHSKVRIESISADQSKMLVRFSTPDNPGLLFFFDAATGELARLAAMNEAIGGKRLSRGRMVRYKARDGLEIEGVLTMPRGRRDKDLPFIVMPHGGPWGHDELSYDYWAQFLAERGYAVLQPNFRGSTGYGAAFEKAGQGQMGFAMQDDVTDGVQWAVKEGIADPKRVCIVGGSYGGYAAMWGIAKDPDLYRCAVSINGVANLRREVNDFGGLMRERLYRTQWQKMTPDFAAVSPINAIARIKAPLLLVHGRKDVTVDHVQSARMYSAMTKAGKTVEFVSVPLADHYFTRQADRMTLLTSIESFLAKHNPAD
ncbi:alpha/beta hydrolase family protein [Sphingopyxis sp. YR583]|uniref:alpha/beta hydrolase family protein n=1 Tax=Sphingopyxis sp. YR583 TaxID=1881047 RepID=UPI0015A57D44|nr:S9 family peptidase [Sphingopyxis sp. YR583]